MFAHQWRSWPPNAVVAGENEHIVDPTRRWVPSPEAQLFPLPADSAGEEGSAARMNRVVPEVKSSQRSSRQSIPPPSRDERERDPLTRRPSRLSVSYWKRRLGFKSRKKKDSDDAEHWPSLYGERRKVQYAEWKAYGYWARPTIGTALVRNATPPSDRWGLSERQVEAVMRSVQGSDDGHPENWIARLEHPALPPRPSPWPTPPPSPSPPTPDTLELQLNPFLEHRTMGASPVCFDIRFDIRAVLLGECEPVPDSDQDESDSVAGSMSAGPSGRTVNFQTGGPNGAQPATFPGVRSFEIIALADDILLDFPWHMSIRSRRELITVADVLEIIFKSFQQFLKIEELASLSKQRREQTERAWRERVRHVPFVPQDDGQRRVDFLGDRFMFRGLEPTPDGQGFMMFVGPPR